MSEEHYYGYISCFKGESSDLIEPEKYSIPQSLSKETTFMRTVVDYNEISNELVDLANIVYNSIVRKKLYFKTINLKLKTTDFKVYTRSISISDYSNKKEDILDNMSQLLEENFDLGEFRLVGVGVSNIITAENYFKQIDLFNYQTKISQREENLIKAINKINSKYKNAIKKIK